MDSTPKSAPDQANDSLLDEAEALIWALLDDNIQPTDIRRLENLLQENEQVRQRYISCVQMHTDLSRHFAEITDPPSLPASPVLGFLGNSQPGADFLPSVTE